MQWLHGCGMQLSYGGVMRSLCCIHILYDDVINSRYGGISQSWYGNVVQSWYRALTLLTMFVIQSWYELLSSMVVLFSPEQMSLGEHSPYHWFPGQGCVLCNNEWRLHSLILPAIIIFTSSPLIFSFVNTEHFIITFVWKAAKHVGNCQA